VESFVIFKIGKTEIKVKARIPINIADEKGKKVMIINNAVSDVKKDIGIDIKELVDDIYAIAEIM
jgi:hypothetical protein